MAETFSLSPLIFYALTVLGSVSFGYIFFRLGWKNAFDYDRVERTGWSVILGLLFSTIVIVTTAFTPKESELQELRQFFFNFIFVTVFALVLLIGKRVYSRVIARVQVSFPEQRQMEFERHEEVAFGAGKIPQPRKNPVPLIAAKPKPEAKLFEQKANEFLSPKPIQTPEPVRQKPVSIAPSFFAKAPEPKPVAKPLPPSQKKEEQESPFNTKKERAFKAGPELEVLESSASVATKKNMPSRQPFEFSSELRVEDIQSSKTRGTLGAQREKLSQKNALADQELNELKKMSFDLSEQEKEIQSIKKMPFSQPEKFPEAKPRMEEMPQKPRFDAPKPLPPSSSKPASTPTSSKPSVQIKGLDQLKKDLKELSKGLVEDSEKKEGE